jgi:hypothetical protein
MSVPRRWPETSSRAMPTSFSPTLAADDGLFFPGPFRAEDRRLDCLGLAKVFWPCGLLARLQRILEFSRFLIAATLPFCHPRCPSVGRGHAAVLLATGRRRLSLRIGGFRIGKGDPYHAARARFRALPERGTYDLAAKLSRKYSINSAKRLVSTPTYYRIPK